LRGAGEADPLENWSKNHQMTILIGSCNPRRSA
jgi:hypothetical protein